MDYVYALLEFYVRQHTRQGHIKMGTDQLVAVHIDDIHGHMNTVYGLCFCVLGVLRPDNALGHIKTGTDQLVIVHTRLTDIGVMQAAHGLFLYVIGGLRLGNTQGIIKMGFDRLVIVHT